MTTATVKEKDSLAGETNCLGWCGKKFWSPDKTRIRFCAKCRGKRNTASDTMSRMEMRLLGGRRGESPIPNEE